MLTPVRPSPEPTDKDLLLILAAGDHSALAPLYQRYVPVVYRMAAQSLGSDAAEDIVQDVFASVWKNAETYDPARGAVRPWILQIARARVLNELRRRSRKPESNDERDAAALQEHPDGDSQPEQTLWQDYRRSAVQKAIASLPPPQRQALSLAFFEDLTHEQVSNALQVPLGTTKTRIRSGIQRLRVVLAGIAAVLVAIVAAGLALQYRLERVREARTEAALRLVTTSDTQALRLTAAPGTPAQAHGNYRFRPEARVAVLTFSDLPLPPSGKTYQAWIGSDGKWVALGEARPDATGHGLIIYEGREPLGKPDAVQITLEPETGSPSPSGPALISWTAR